MLRRRDLPLCSTPPTPTYAMIENRKLRAPARHGEALFDPPLDAAAELVEQNISRAHNATVEIAGRRLTDLAAEARRLLVRDAHQYTTTYRNAPALSYLAEDRLLLAGHQPQLFHPGVWFKNFALSALGRRLDAVAVNLVIDNDAAGPPALRVPAGSVQEPRLESIPFDKPGSVVPYEERSVLDRETFRQFASHVKETLTPFVPNPLVTRLWPYALEALDRTNNLGQSLSQARHRLEADLDLQTLELPLSHVCRTPVFAHFVAALLQDLPRFIEIHNQALYEYRRTHRLRSRTHPVPSLALEDEWCEAPFWVWSREDPTRRRLFVRRPNPHEVELSDRQHWSLRLPLRKTGNVTDAVSSLLRLHDAGVRLRPRALMTTLYARLFLGDLFLHGIGGAKYDELTDALIRRYFELTPPTFYAVTATVLLPVERPGVTIDDLRRVEQQLRELRYHPEQYVSYSPEAAPYIEAKRRWLATEPPRGARRERHLGIEQANAALQPFVEPLRRQLEQEREALQRALQKERLLASREFSFCLFPEGFLPPLFERLLEK